MLPHLISRFHTFIFLPLYLTRSVEDAWSRICWDFRPSFRDWYFLGQTLNNSILKSCFNSHCDKDFFCPRVLCTCRFWPAVRDAISSSDFPPVSTKKNPLCLWFIRLSTTPHFPKHYDSYGKTALKVSVSLSLWDHLKPLLWKTKCRCCNAYVTNWHWHLITSRSHIKMHPFVSHKILCSIYLISGYVGSTQLDLWRIYGLIEFTQNTCSKPKFTKKNSYATSEDVQSIYCCPRTDMNTGKLFPYYKPDRKKNIGPTKTKH